MKTAVRPLAELALFAGAVTAPLLPLGAAVAAVVLLAVLWLALRPSRREAVVVLAGAAVATGALATAWLGEVRGFGRAVPADEARAGYRAAWEELAGEAAGARDRLGHPPAGSDEVLAAFRTLAAEAEPSAERRRTLLLFDPDGTAVAWAGEGLVHDLKPEAIPRGPVGYLASVSAVTLMAAEPLGDSRRPWKVVAARSFSTDRLPFAGLLGRRPPLRWSLVGEGERGTAGTVPIAVTGLPTLVVEAPDTAAAGPGSLSRLLRIVAWAALALAFLALAVMRSVGFAIGVAAGPNGVGRALAAAVPTLAGAAALARAAAVPEATFAAMVVGILVAVVGLVFGRELPGRWSGAVWGSGALAATTAAAWGYQRWLGPSDLAAGLLEDPAAVCLRMGLFATVFGLLAFAARRRPAAGEDLWGWTAVAALVVSGAAPDLPVVAVLGLLAGGGSAGLWFQSRPVLSRATGVAAFVLIVALASASSWQLAFRLSLRAEVGSILRPEMATPSAAELARLGAGLESFFEERELDRLVPRSLEGLERHDVAFALWKGSPLARRNALSALVVRPRDGAPSVFSFGLPLTEDGELDTSPESWEELRLPVWEGSLVTGEAELLYRGRPWATARYYLLLRPGFRIEGERPFAEMEARLLAGEAAADRPVAGLPAQVSYALYSPEGRALRSPWDEAPPMPPAIADAGTAPVRVQTPRGAAWAFASRGADGWEVLYLRILSPLAALERFATQGLGVLLVLAGLGIAAMLLALPRPAFRGLVARSLHSYSQRLIIVYTVLLLVPLLALNFVLVTAAGDRLRREQRASGEAALRSAQRVLGDYVLYLEPGFSIDTTLDDALLIWLSRVVHHEVNLYWGSEVNASSKPELFTAGLLPKRIPGEIYARLALLGYDLSSRTNHAGDATYLELYAPLRVPGVPAGNERLFLSVPLLAQQEEVSRELEALRRQSLLVTAALFGILIAVGLRLARSFTTPLEELVEGTRRIAAGAPSLDLAPTEHELAALVSAVDDMARRIAEGRERLLREKAVVERMVDHITSGVVSLDRERRVLMSNRVAADLLGVEVGEKLDGSLAARPRLGPVAAFLAEGTGELRHRTVRLASPDGEEREWTLVSVPVPGSGEPAELLVVEDATEVLRGQRLEAWAEMARVIAHEIKNPLTPIRLNAEHIQRVHGTDRAHFDLVFERCIGNILSQVDELQEIASEFSAYSSILRLERREGDLAAAMRELAEPYRAAPPTGVEVEFEARPPVISARFDRKLLTRAVRNLLENALRASERGGRVTLSVAQADGQARIAVRDRGPGVSVEMLPRIFDPYFSTHSGGTGLGLPIARRIAEEHGGVISARNRPGGGLAVTITIPLK